MLTKRTLLKAALATGVVTVFSGLVPGMRAIAQQGLRVRRNVNTMSLDDPDLQTYRDFVGLMRARPQSNPVSWVGFANQHGNARGYKYCPHGDWYFLPWHRAYMEMYEKAAAALMKNPSFAMPYWDWTTLRQLPAAFTAKTYKGKPNPLYVPGRGDPTKTKRNALTGANALTDELVGPDVMRKIYQETDYEVFGTSRSVDRSNPSAPVVQNSLDPKWVPMGGGTQGTLESVPHNNVHNNIGGFMPYPNSPRDPVFMMHHGNIDRIWAHWNALGRQNSQDALWRDMSFTNNYISPEGQLYTRVVKDLESTAALGYTYDETPSPDNKPVDALRAANLAALFNPAATGTPRRFAMSNTAAARSLAPLKLSVPIASEAVNTVVEPAPGSAGGREIVARITDIRMGDKVRALRIFINRETVSLDVPSSDIHYVTTVGFLKHAMDTAKAHDSHHGKLPSVIVNLTDTVQRLSKTGRLSTDSITVQILPVPEPGVLPAAVGDVVPTSVEIAII